MGTVIGPVTWSPNSRLASWYLLRELRESVKYMKKTDREAYKEAIQKEETTVTEEFKKYVTSH